MQAAAATQNWGLPGPSPFNPGILTHFNGRYKLQRIKFSSLSVIHQLICRKEVVLYELHTKGGFFFGKEARNGISAWSITGPTPKNTAHSIEL